MTSSWFFLSTSCKQVQEIKVQMNRTNVLTKTVMDALYVTNQKQHYNIVLYGNEYNRGTSHPTHQKRDCNVLLPKWLQTPGGKVYDINGNKGQVIWSNMTLLNTRPCSMER